MNEETELANPTAFQLKAGLYTLTTFWLQDPLMRGLATQLAAKVSQAPQFFKGAPIVIDLQRVRDAVIPIHFTTLRDTLLNQGIHPVGVRGGNPTQHEAALLAGLPVLPESKESRPEPKESGHVLPFSAQNKLITQPVRSGQQITAPAGDLTVIAAVSPGAELLADGHIHIYGALRGRALAGINGNRDAKIFCLSLEAELVSIAGQYTVNEDLMKSEFWRQAVKIEWADDKLKLALLPVRAGNDL